MTGWPLRAPTCRCVATHCRRYDPALYEPMPLPQGSELVFGEPPPPPPVAAAGQDAPRPYR